MSRIGRLPVSLPTGVTFQVNGGSMSAKGPKGALTRVIPSHVAVSVDGTTVTVTRNGDSKPARERHGLTRTLVQNLVTGVTEGFSRQLELVGVGYKAEMKGRTLIMHLGYSHPIEFEPVDGVSIQVQKELITVTGIDKEVVGQAAANIRAFRKPDAYKGKGVRYRGEQVRLKAGKSGK